MGNCGPSKSQPSVIENNNRPTEKPDQDRHDEKQQNTPQAEGNVDQHGQQTVANDDDDSRPPVEGKEEKEQTNKGDCIVKCKLPDLALVDMPLPQFVMEKFDEYADKKALINSLTGDSLTYAELKEKTKKFGAGLHKYGFQKGEVFALCLPNIPEYAVVFFGVTMLGGVVTPLNPTYTSKELSTQCKDAEAKYILTMPALADLVKDIADTVGIAHRFSCGDVEGFESMDSLLESDSSECPDVDIDSNDVFVMPYSSGTTGMMKGVMLTHRNLVSNIQQFSSAPFFEIKKEDVTMGLLPICHIYGMCVIMSANLRAGSTIVLLPKFDPAAFLKALQEYKVTIAPVVPPIVLLLTKHPAVAEHDLSSLREVGSGAAPLDEKLSDALMAKLPTLEILRQGFGMTELSPIAFLNRTDHCKSGSVGPLIYNTEGKVVDVDSGEALGVGEDGEICVKGPQVMKGYLKNEEATARTVDSEGWLHTGDIGHYDEEGYFYVVDRLKELIKYRGKQVPPAELEALLISHSSILDAAVIGVPDEECGEIAKAYVVRKGEELTEGQVMEFVKENVAAHKHLHGGVEFVEAIPKSSSGKILRKDLKAKATAEKDAASN